MLKKAKAWFCKKKKIDLSLVENWKCGSGLDQPAS